MPTDGKGREVVERGLGSLRIEFPRQCISANNLGDFDIWIIADM